MDKALCQASEQIGRRLRFILSTSLKLAIAALPVQGGQRSSPAVLGHTLFPELDVDAWEDLHLLHGIRST